MNLILFEDSGYRKLNPLVLSRPVFDLRCGIQTLLEKIRRLDSQAAVNLSVREELTQFTKREHQDCEVNRKAEENASVLAINGRALWNKELNSKLQSMESLNALFAGDQIVALKLPGEVWNRLHPLESGFVGRVRQIPDLKIQETTNGTIRYPWDLILKNGEQIVADFSFLTGGKTLIAGDLASNVTCMNPAQIQINPGAVIKPGVILDAEAGPIFIDNEAIVLPNAFLEGPLYIGKHSLIKAGAKIYENTSIGPVCKVGGEVEESIIHAYSNKQHEGFLGHVYLGSWVNIGADSNNSDLKNNYGNVKMMIDGELVDSGTQFLGLVMGDHSKCGINSTLNTGTVVSFNCNLYGPELHAKYIPSFSWGGNGHYETYRLEKAMEVAAKVMARRKVEFSELDRKLFSTIFQQSASERETWNIIH